MSTSLTQILQTQNTTKTLWELFHLNSKISRYTQFPSNQYVANRMAEMYETLPYRSYPEIELPKPELDQSYPLAQAIHSRTTANDLVATELTLAQLSKLLYAGYGINRPAAQEVGARGFRTVPSGGALYPLDLFIHLRTVQNIDAGLYHFDPTRHSLRLICADDMIESLRDAFAQPNLLSDTSIQIFLIGLFERTVFKYGDLGYRFTHIESGHIAQNICLMSQSMDLSTVCVGGFYGEQLDKLLGLDGINQSTIYVLCIGTADDE